MYTYTLEFAGRLRLLLAGLWGLPLLLTACGGIQLGGLGPPAGSENGNSNTATTSRAIGSMKREDRRAGTGFFIQGVNGAFVVTASHLREAVGGTPTGITIDAETYDLGSPSFNRNDVLVLPVIGDVPTTLPINSRTISTNTTLRIESPRGNITGRFGSNNYTPGDSISDDLIFLPDTAFGANGYSGSPIVYTVTGEVVGVVLNANNTDFATSIGFRPLDFN